METGKKLCPKAENRSDVIQPHCGPRSSDTEMRTENDRNGPDSNGEHQPLSDPIHDRRQIVESQPIPLPCEHRFHGYLGYLLFFDPANLTLVELEVWPCRPGDCGAQTCLDFVI